VSERAGDGVALIYGAAAPDAMPPLRAAAGFESPEAARRTAEALAPEARAALASRQPLRMEASDALGARGAGGLLAVPLRVDDRLHGALLCASPEPLTPSAEREVQRLAEQLALRIDHDRLRRELAALRDRAEDARQSAHAREDEILHLSEALFAQDVELLRTHAELGRVEQLKHDFIEKMSRELRTPLNGIIEAIIAVLATLVAPRLFGQLDRSRVTAAETQIDSLETALRKLVPA